MYQNQQVQSCDSPCSPSLNSTENHVERRHMLVYLLSANLFFVA